MVKQKTKPRTQTLQFSVEKIFKTIQRNFKNGKAVSSTLEYFMGMLLMPWIWVFGFLTLITVFVYFYNVRASEDIVRYGIPIIFKYPVNLNNLWGQSFFYVFLNYTLAFFSQSRYPKLKIFFVFTSYTVLLLLFIITWPHVQQILRK